MCVVAHVLTVMDIITTLINVYESIRLHQNYTIMILWLIKLTITCLSISIKNLKAVVATTCVGSYCVVAVLLTVVYA
jgi:hypothetical protein